jgi:hypothetical protein
MQVRHLVLAALLVSATAAHAETVRPHTGTLTGWVAPTLVVGASTAAAIEVPVPSAAIDVQAPAAAPIVAADPVVGAAEVPEPSSIALLLAGVMGVGALRRRRK